MIGSFVGWCVVIFRLFYGLLCWWCISVWISGWMGTGCMYGCMIVCVVWMGMGLLVDVVYVDEVWMFGGVGELLVVGRVYGYQGGRMDGV